MRGFKWLIINVLKKFQERAGRVGVFERDYSRSLYLFPGIGSIHPFSSRLRRAMASPLPYGLVSFSIANSSMETIFFSRRSCSSLCSSFDKLDSLPGGENRVGCPVAGLGSSHFMSSRSCCAWVSKRALPVRIRALQPELLTSLIRPGNANIFLW